MFFLKGMFLILLIVLCYGLPLANWASFIALSTALYALVLNKINNRKILWYISLIIIGSLLITRYSINNSKIEIGEQIYSPNDLILNESLPEQIEKEARRDIDLLRLPFSITPANIIKTENPWAFSADSFFSKPKMSRTVNSLNFKNRYDFRVGVLNNAKYNYFGQNMGSSGAYYPLLFHFQIPKSLKNEQLCWVGNIFIQINNNWQRLYSDKKKCFILKDYFEPTEQQIGIFGFDFNKDKPLSISLKNKKHLLLFLLSIFSSISILLLLTRLNRDDLILLGLSIAGVIIFLLDQHIRGGHPEALSGFPYMGRGNDGLTHYSYAREMTAALSKNDIFEWLKGKESIFYYMPGMRYMWGLSMPIFGESFFGLLSLISLAPLAIRNILSNIATRNWQIILLLCFLCIPIFEAFGFFHLYLIKYSIEGFGAGLAIASLLGSVSILWKKNNYRFKKYELILAGLFLAIALGLRPNYVPAIIFILLGFSLYFILIEKRIINALMLGFGFFPVLLIPLHNYYFGKRLILITSSADIQNNMRNGPDIWMECFYSSKIACNQILEHINIWISYKEPWYIVTFLFLWIVVFNKKFSYFEKIFATSMITGHAVFLFYEGVARYSHGIWVISFLLSIPVISKLIWPKLSKIYLVSSAYIK